MNAHSSLPFEAIVELVEQLPVEQQQMLLNRIQGHIRHNGLSVDEKMRLLRCPNKCKSESRAITTS